MPLCLRSSSLRLPGLCPHCHLPKLPLLMAGPHPNIMRGNTQTSSEGCCSWEKSCSQSPVCRDKDITAAGDGAAGWQRCSCCYLVLCSLCPKDSLSCPSLYQGFHGHYGPLRGPVYPLLPSFPCSPAFPDRNAAVLLLSAVRFS